VRIFTLAKESCFFYNLKFTYGKGSFIPSINKFNLQKYGISIQLTFTSKENPPLSIENVQASIPELTLGTAFKLHTVTVMNLNSKEFHLFVPFHRQLQRFHGVGSFGNILGRSPDPESHIASRDSGESVITANKLASYQCK
jgi:hypothetical protein